MEPHVQALRFLLSLVGQDAILTVLANLLLSHIIQTKLSCSDRALGREELRSDHCVDI